MAASSKALSSQYQVSLANPLQCILSGRIRVGSMSQPRKRHGSHPSATHPSQRERSYWSPSNRCRLERGFPLRIPTASRSTRNLSSTKPLGPSYPSPSNAARWWHCRRRDHSAPLVDIGKRPLRWPNSAAKSSKTRVSGLALVTAIDDCPPIARNGCR